MALERGFTAYAYTNSRHYQTYTHRIVVNDQGDGFHRDYLVKAVGLKQLKTQAWEAVNFNDFLDWKKRSAAFSGASLVVVASRHEPFGYVILEAMQAGVPVMFPKHAGAGEVLQSGIRIDPEQLEETAKQIIRLLQDKESWQQVVNEQLEEISSYAKRAYEEGLILVWNNLNKSKDEAATPLSNANTSQL